MRMQEAKDVMENLLQKAGRVQKNADDYIGEDGLLHCGKCKGKKQTRLPPSIFTNNEERVVSCICQCEAEEKKKKEQEEEYRKAMARIERLKSASLIDDKLRYVNLSTFQKTSDNQKAYQLAERYVKNFADMYTKRQGILFWGPVGTGKSYTAACIANELMNGFVPVIMTSFVKILQNIQGDKEEESEIIKRLDEAKLLIIDDLGTERNTDYALEKVYNIIDSRYRSGKPLVLTTNMTLKEMQENTDIRYKRIYDRIFEMCFPVRVAGSSWRQAEAAKRFDEMKKLTEE